MLFSSDMNAVKKGKETSLAPGARSSTPHTWDKITDRDIHVRTGKRDNLTFLEKFKVISFYRTG